MKVSARMKFLGAERGTAQQSGKPYFYVGLLQDMDSERVYVNEEMFHKVSSYKPFCDVDCKLNIQIGAKTFVNLDDIQLVK